MKFYADGTFAMNDPNDGAVERHVDFHVNVIARSLSTDRMLISLVDQSNPSTDRG